MCACNMLIYITFRIKLTTERARGVRILFADCKPVPVSFGGKVMGQQQVGELTMVKFGALDARRFVAYEL